MKLSNKTTSLAVLAFSALCTSAAQSYQPKTSDTDYHVDMVLKIDGKVVGTPSINFQNGQSFSVEDVSKGYKLEITTAQDIKSRAKELFQIELSSDDVEHTLLETEIFTKSTATQNWTKIAAPVLLSEVGSTGTVEQKISSEESSIQYISLEATVFKE